MNSVSLPHPEAGDHQERHENEPRGEGIVRDVLERTVNISDDGNREDEVDPPRYDSPNGKLWSAVHEPDPQFGIGTPNKSEYC